MSDRFNKFWDEINADSHYGLPIFKESDKHVAEVVYDYLNPEIQSLTKRIEILEHDNKKLVEMGRFYGDKDIYRSKNGGHIENKNFHSKIGKDCGKRARETMKELRGKY